MAKRSENTGNAVAEEYYEVPARSYAWLWALLVIALIGLVVAVLHMSGALRGPEESLYQATKDTPVINLFTGALHEDAEQLSPEKVISVKDLRSNVIRAETDIKEIKGDLKKLDDVSKQIESMQGDIDKIKKALKDITEYGLDESVQTSAAVRTAAPAAQAATRAAPAGTSAKAGAGSSSTTSNYRLVGKIFEKIDADTSVDILNNMTDAEKVSILGKMKEKTVAEILSAFDPAKSAELTRMIAASK